MQSAKARDFTDLIVWQKSHALVLKIYSITRTFPAEERYGLVSQMRRAGVSIAANIAEGFKRQGSKSKILFYNISQTSLEEVRYYFILARDLGYAKDTKKIMADCQEIARLLKGLMNAIRDAD